MKIIYMLVISVAFGVCYAREPIHSDDEFNIQEDQDLAQPELEPEEMINLQAQEQDEVDIMHANQQLLYSPEDVAQFLGRNVPQPEPRRELPVWLERLIRIGYAAMPIIGVLLLIYGVLTLNDSRRNSSKQK